MRLQKGQYSIIRNRSPFEPFPLIAGASAIAVLLALLSGCIGNKRIDPAENFNAATTQTIAAAEETRAEALRTLGAAMERGIDIPEATVIRLGDEAKTAIDTAKSTLAAYITSGGSRAGIYSAMAALNAAMASLVTEMTLRGLEAPQ
jgi:hypothetical protein